MKAAVLHQLGSLPKYEDFDAPVPENNQQVLISVKAASLKNLDKGRASGKHYASYTNLPATVGFDGVGELPDGTHVYAQGLTGMMAEKALASVHRIVPLPENLDYVTAAALPNAIIGAAMALQYRAKVKKGDTVLINGATGFTGMVAVQLAKYYGAKKVIATGRNADLLQKTLLFGADEIVSLKDDDERIINTLAAIHTASPIDIVIDYLWGHPVELVLAALKHSDINTSTHKVRIVTVGSMAGEYINLSSGTLRSSDIELLGSGLGSLSQEELRDYKDKVLPEMFRLAADGKLHIETETVDLGDIETAWAQQVQPGKRLVVII